MTTNQRPDVVLCSYKTKTFVILELTVPQERRIVDEHIKKLDRYADLCEEIKKDHWKTHNFAIEVGMTGMLSTHFGSAMKELGIYNAKFFSDVATMALRCTYILWLSRFTKEWDPQWDFIDGLTERD